MEEKVDCIVHKASLCHVEFVTGIAVPDKTLFTLAFIYFLAKKTTPLLNFLKNKQVRLLPRMFLLLADTVICLFRAWVHILQGAYWCVTALLFEEAAFDPISLLVGRWHMINYKNTGLCNNNDVFCAFWSQLAHAGHLCGTAKPDLTEMLAF